MSYTELKNKFVKTRKDHTCEGCLENQSKGTVLRARAYIWEGDFHSEYLCCKCDQVLDDMDPRDLEDGWYPGELKNGWQYLEGAT